MISINMTLFDFVPVVLGSLLISSVLNYLVELVPVKMHESWRLDTIEYVNRLVPDASTSVHEQLNADRIRLMYTPLDFLLLHRGVMSKGHWLTVVMTVAGTMLTVGKFEVTLTTLCLLGFVYALIVGSFIDIRHLSLPDAITLPLVWAGIAGSYFHLTPASLDSSIAGAMLGYLSLWVVYWLYMWIRKQEGLGFGDLKLLAAIGAWLGVSMLLTTVAIAIISAMVCVLMGYVSQSVTGKLIDRVIPFGPFLSLGACLSLFFGDTLLDAYMALM